MLKVDHTGQQSSHRCRFRSIRQVAAPSTGPRRTTIGGGIGLSFRCFFHVYDAEHDMQTTPIHSFCHLSEPPGPD